ncbi:GNAT family N-acetyltransferase [Arthrobacter sp. 7749]|nr:GNAT family N-acetyltransferase [Arthrobacter sp. 7749]
MSPFTMSTSPAIPDVDVLSLYNAVGWTAYTDSPELLFQAIKNSSFVVSARNEDGQLVGLARAISDDATICYLQDILVHPDLHRTGVGRVLFERVLERYEHVRQTVLITDDEPWQRAFYESMGLTEGADFSAGPVRVFAKFR